ncbi:hypothetical protein OCF84_17105 [Shewanella xiamenensis]|uniref:hypothetical protein n=1 Tax=Shewanella xiamenensis TaxID=332186 RepID=UPI001991167D|nr:hypothetical protein [Shewanella xiamenensis]MCL1071149.1 hypothetical protein [Shewanella xiamenensis]MCR4535966.1 hypothetical protein [Shewanella xiamenensis]MDI5837454.1 hypothetical protein [Shewanella xiamenensis]MDI5841666.1 hypothetical protein [Shewanella xiamenensis]MDI5845346.1 hypothetical protein [Shewanella xiamenensis]
MEDVISQENNPLKSDEKQITVDSNIHRVPLFHVSLAKFVIMFFATFGLYQIYWFYKQWQALKEYYDLDAWPIARCIFTVFFTHSLFMLMNILKKIIEVIVGIILLWRQFTFYLS